MRLVENIQKNLKESEYEELYGESTDYTEMRKMITALRSICDEAEEDGFDYTGKFQLCITELSDILEDLEEFYEERN